MKILNTQKATRAFGRKVLTVKKNSPHIFFAAGVAGFVGTTVLACKATMKLEKVLDDIEVEIRDVKQVAEENQQAGRPYDEKEHYKDLAYVYGKGAGRLIRLYGPSIVLGAASIGALTGSHVQMTRRNSALTATLAAVSKAYDEYRIRIQEEIGEDRERDIYRGVTSETEGEGKKKETYLLKEGNGFSIYARLFEESNMNWRKDPEETRFFIQCQQNYANQLLQARGHVFLNEVYDSLGLERSQAGQLVGWVLDGDGDGYIDFGMYETRNTDFINGHEKNVWLDFNVDGVVLEKF